MRATIMTTPMLWAIGRCVEYYPTVYKNMIHLFPFVLAAEEHLIGHMKLEKALKRSGDQLKESMRDFTSNLEIWNNSKK